MHHHDKGRAGVLRKRGEKTLQRRHAARGSADGNDDRFARIARATVVYRLLSLALSGTTTLRSRGRSRAYPGNRSAAPASSGRNEDAAYRVHPGTARGATADAFGLAAAPDYAAWRFASLAVLQHHGRRRGIGDRDVIVAVHFAHLPGQRAAHRHPVEKFDALGAGFFDEIVDRIARQRNPARRRACPCRADRTPC